jgi:hypothetical protein
MSKKDYIAIARLISKHTTSYEPYTIPFAPFVNDLMDYLKEENPNFNRVKFANAVCKHYEDEPIAR